MECYRHHVRSIWTKPAILAVGQQSLQQLGLTQYSLQHEVSAWNNRPAFQTLERPALDPE